MADILYDSFKLRCADGTFDMDADTFKCALLTSTHTPNAADAVFADLDNEVTGTGYTAGGATLTNVTWTLTDGTAKFDADDPVWADATITARYAVIYKFGTANSLTNPLVCLLDLGADKGVTGGTYSVNLAATGIATLS